MAVQHSPGAWIDWSGGASGENEADIWNAVAIRLRDGRELDCTDAAPCLRWRHTGDGTDIIAYRLANGRGDA